MNTKHTDSCKCVPFNKDILDTSDCKLHHVSTKHTDSVEAYMKEFKDNLKALGVSGADLVFMENWLKHVITTLQATHSQQVEEAVRKERERIESEVGGFIAGAYALKFEDNSREAKFWDVWKDGYEQCHKDALNAIKYENRGQD